MLKVASTHLHQHVDKRLMLHLRRRSPTIQRNKKTRIAANIHARVDKQAEFSKLSWPQQPAQYEIIYIQSHTMLDQHLDDLVAVLAFDSLLQGRMIS
jgi:hypothetical protein